MVCFRRPLGNIFRNPIPPIRNFAQGDPSVHPSISQPPPTPLSRSHHSPDHIRISDHVLTTMTSTHIACVLIIVLSLTLGVSTCSATRLQKLAAASQKRKAAARAQQVAHRLKIGLNADDEHKDGGYDCPPHIRDVCELAWTKKRDARGRPLLEPDDQLKCENLQRLCVYDIDYNLVGRTKCGDVFPQEKGVEGTDCTVHASQFERRTVRSCGGVTVAAALSAARLLALARKPHGICAPSLANGFHFSAQGESAPSLDVSAPPPPPPLPYPPIILGTADSGFPRLLPHVSPPPRPPPRPRPPPPAAHVCSPECVAALSPIVAHLRECEDHSDPAKEALRVVSSAYEVSCGVNKIHAGSVYEPRVDFQTPQQTAREVKRYNATDSRVYHGRNATERAFFSPGVRHETVRAASRGDVLAYKHRNAENRREETTDELLDTYGAPPPPAPPGDVSGGRFAQRSKIGERLGLDDRHVQHVRAPAPPASPGQPPSPHGLVHMVTSQEQRDESRNPTGLRAAFGALDDDVRIKATTKDGHDDHLHHHHHHHGAL